MFPFRYSPPVNLAGASGGTGGAYCGLPEDVPPHHGVGVIQHGRIGAQPVLRGVAVERNQPAVARAHVYGQARCVVIAARIVW